MRLVLTGTYNPAGDCAQRGSRKWRPGGHVDGWISGLPWRQGKRKGSDVQGTDERLRRGPSQACGFCSFSLSLSDVRVVRGGRARAAHMGWSVISGRWILYVLVGGSGSVCWVLIITSVTRDGDALLDLSCCSFERPRCD